MTSVKATVPDPSIAIESILFEAIHDGMNPRIGRFKSLMNWVNGLQANSSGDFSFSPDQLEIITALNPETRHFEFVITWEDIKKIKDQLKNELKERPFFNVSSKVDELFETKLTEYLGSVSSDAKVKKVNTGVLVSYPAKEFLKSLRNVLHDSFCLLMGNTLVPYLEALIDEITDYESKQAEHGSSESASSPELIKSMLSQDLLYLMFGRGGDTYMLKLRETKLAGTLNPAKGIYDQVGPTFYQLLSRFFGEDAAVEPNGEDAAVEPNGEDAAVEPNGEDAAVESQIKQPKHWAKSPVLRGMSLKNLMFPDGIIQDWIMYQMNDFLLRHDVGVRMEAVMPMIKGVMPTTMQLRILTPEEKRIHQRLLPMRVAMRKIFGSLGGKPLMRMSSVIGGTQRRVEEVVSGDA